MKTTTSSKRYWKLNPGDIDNSQMDDLGGFKNAKAHDQDPAYNKILNKTGKGSVPTHGTTHPSLTPPKHETHEDFKDWRRGKATEAK